MPQKIIKYGRTQSMCLKKKVHKACWLKIYVSMLGFGHMGSTCLKMEVRKACTFAIGPSHEYFCGIDAEFIYSEILALINPDCNNRFLFSSPVFLSYILTLFSYVFWPPPPRINHREPPVYPPSSRLTSDAAIMLSSNPLSQLSSACDWATLLDPPATPPGAAAVSNPEYKFLQVPLYLGGVSARLGYS